MGACMENFVMLSLSSFVFKLQVPVFPVFLDLLLFPFADMPDGGAAHFAQTVRETKARYAI